MAVPSQLTVWRELRHAQRRAPSPRVVAASLLSIGINTVAATREAHGGGDVIELLVDVHQLARLATTFAEMAIVERHREVPGRGEVAGIRRERGRVLGAAEAWT